MEQLLDLQKVDKDVAGLGEAAPSPSVEEDKSIDHKHKSGGVTKKKPT